MMRAALYMLFAVATSAQAAQVYRWVDSAGGVHYTDQPPPASVKQVKTLSGQGNVIEADKSSYSSKIAHEKNPVTLYGGDCGPVCEEARIMLKKRGIVFEEKDPAKDRDAAEAMRQLTGTLEIPVVVVGTAHQKGYDAAIWNRMLDVAGYPKTPLIPPKP